MDNLLNWLLNLGRPQLVAPQLLEAKNIPETQFPTAADFSTGFKNYGSNIPIATGSAQLAQGAQRLPKNIDPYLAAVIALMETQGGLRQTANNNPFNILGTQGGQRQFINYNSLPEAILGGTAAHPSGFYGTVLNNPAYAPFRQSGNLEDFFNVYTPPGSEYGNPSLEQLLERYASIRGNFPQGRGGQIAKSR